MLRDRIAGDVIDCFNCDSNHVRLRSFDRRDLGDVDSCVVALALGRRVDASFQARSLLPTVKR